MADEAAVEAAQRLLLGEIDKNGSAESESVAKQLGWDHMRVVGMMKSLESFGLITAEVLYCISAGAASVQQRGFRARTDCLRHVLSPCRRWSTTTGPSRRRGGDTWRMELPRRRSSARFQLKASLWQP